MRHIRDATRSYAPRTTIHTTSDNTATLALRLHQMTTPTLLSPSNTRYIYRERRNELTPEFQSNGFLKSPSRFLLAGLGIHYELDSSDIVGEAIHSYDEPQGVSYIQADDISSALHHSTPAGTAYQLTDRTAKHLTRLSDSQNSLAMFSDTSLPDLGYSSSSSSASLASTRFASDNEEARAFSLPYHLADGVLSCSPSNIGLIPDVNMYNLALFTKQPSVGVDPLDTMGRSSASAMSPYLSPRNATFCCSSPLSIQYPVPSTLGAMGESTPRPLSQDCPSPGIIHDIVTILSTSATQEPDQPESMTVTYSEQPSFEQCALQKRARASPIMKMDNLPDGSVLHVFSPKQEGLYVLSSYENLSFSSSDRVFSPRQIKPDPDHIICNDQYPSPILNAHTGIELTELTFRAQRYRARHSAQQIDRGWLMHFAGKLTDRGELIDEFRCYVVGCGQRNKRRDHIIVHVGAHVDQRPFGCSMCSQRFLRKNECKRHEASHTGVRPYHCEVCGQTFVRQDLLKRHSRRSHDVEKGSRSAGSRRKKARTE
ncbi:uncharacterized protein EDB91DRAFT_1215221 [Suillus paluster]|uniref:uncharacterized protein n=1 Tax=Suillus paluster TaxID=48578 RepID=UPI001B865412|nr:uncharacterized protein EDB91DRAFT_1215221 [Suillus paluster]KAG1753801.1 hypothetical protein EDB91DRAFT_1215221 [Suillus paluster]